MKDFPLRSHNLNAYGQEYSSFTMGSGSFAAAGERNEAFPSSEASTLELYVNNRNLFGVGCKSRFCSDCCKRLGWETRKILVSRKANLFKKPQLLSLTIDPKRFSSQEEAFVHITEGGYIRRLLRLLNITVWVWVLEPQKTGMPHWHILADMSERGGLSPADLRRVWRLWRDKWKLGGLKLSRKHKGFKSPEHALNYITKYMLKAPVNGWPEWILKRRVRCVQASKAVGAILFRRLDNSERLDLAVRKPRITRTTLERVQSCKHTCVIMERGINVSTGEINSWKFRKLVSVPYSDILTFMRSIEEDSLCIKITGSILVQDGGREVIEILNTGRFLAFVNEYSKCIVPPSCTLLNQERLKCPA